jgi:hypothetical protein
MISIEQMRQHINVLVEQNDIVVCRQPLRRPGEGWGSYQLEEIRIAPIRSQFSYAAALHEIGHV